MIIFSVSLGGIPRMSFGLSPSDIVTLINVVTKTYQGWRGACGEYTTITNSLNDLRVLIERIQTEACRPGGVLVKNAKDAKDLEDMLSSLELTVEELYAIVDRYRGLGLEKSRKRNWERIAFGAKSLHGLRLKLAQHVTTLTAYLQAIGLGAQSRNEETLARVEAKLDIRPDIRDSIDALAAEIRAGRREGSVMSIYEDDDRAIWKQFRRELISEGHKSSTIHQYKPQILRYLRRLVEQGLLEEDEPPLHGVGSGPPRQVAGRRTSKPASDEIQRRASHAVENEDVEIHGSFANDQVHTKSAATLATSIGSRREPTGSEPWNPIDTMLTFPFAFHDTPAVPIQRVNVEWVGRELRTKRDPTTRTLDLRLNRFVFRDYSGSIHEHRATTTFLRNWTKLTQGGPHFIAGPQSPVGKPSYLLIRLRRPEELPVATTQHVWQCPYPLDKGGWRCKFYGILAEKHFDCVASIKRHLHSEHKVTGNTPPRHSVDDASEQAAEQISEGSSSPRDSDFGNEGASDDDIDAPDSTVWAVRETSIDDTPPRHFADDLSQAAERVPQESCARSDAFSDNDPFYDAARAPRTRYPRVKYPREPFRKRLAEAFHKVLPRRPHVEPAGRSRPRPSQGRPWPPARPSSTYFEQAQCDGEDMEHGYHSDDERDWRQRELDKNDYTEHTRRKREQMAHHYLSMRELRPHNGNINMWEEYESQMKLHLDPKGLVHDVEPVILPSLRPMVQFGPKVQSEGLASSSPSEGLHSTEPVAGSLWPLGTGPA